MTDGGVVEVELADGVPIALSRLVALAAARAQVRLIDGRTAELFYVKEAGRRFVRGRAVVCCHGSFLKVPYHELTLVGAR